MWRIYSWQRNSMCNRWIAFSKRCNKHPRNTHLYIVLYELDIHPARIHTERQREWNSHRSSKDKRPLLFSRFLRLFHTYSLARHSTSCICICKHMYMYGMYISTVCKRMAGTCAVWTSTGDYTSSIELHTQPNSLCIHEMPVEERERERPNKQHVLATDVFVILYMGLLQPYVSVCHEQKRVERALCWHRRGTLRGRALCSDERNRVQAYTLMWCMYICNIEACLIYMLFPFFGYIDGWNLI